MAMRIYGLALLLSLLATASGTGTRIASAAIDYFFGVEVVDAAVLHEMRGKFIVGGLEVDIGVHVQTLIDDIKLQTIARLTERGVATEQVIANLMPKSMMTKSDTPEDSAPESPASNGSPQSVTAAQPQVIQITGAKGKSITDVTPPDVDLSGVRDAKGVVVQDQSGFTAVLQQQRNGHFLSVVVNNAHARKITHEVDVNVTVGNFTDFTQGLRAAMRTIQMQRHVISPTLRP